MCPHDKGILDNMTWHFGSHWSLQGLRYSCLQPFFILGQRSIQWTALCKEVKWHILGQKCPQSNLKEYLLEQPPSEVSQAKSSNIKTSMNVSLCRRQHSVRLKLMLFEHSRIKSTQAHMRTGLEVSELPMIYIPCWAQLSNTLIQLEVFKNPHSCLSLLQTKEMIITFASSPWKLLTVAILKALSNVVFWT